MKFKYIIYNMYIIIDSRSLTFTTKKYYYSNLTYNIYENDKNATQGFYQLTKLILKYWQLK